MKNLNDLMDYILYQIIKIIKVIKNHEKVTDNPSIRIYVNKIKNRIIFRIKTGYFLELFMSETMKLLASIKSKITKNENDENVPHLEVIEVVLVHCNIDNNDYQQDSRVLYTIFPSKFLGWLLNISPKSFIKSFDSKFSHTEECFPKESSNHLEIQDKINISLVIK